jgi:putative SOS response-associated peptidase YedK
MCGRYRLSRRNQIVEEHFDSVSGEEDWSPRLQRCPDAADPSGPPESKEPLRKLSLMRWGLIPSWAKDSSVAASMINARSETASTKPAFRDALKFRRCVIPARRFLRMAEDGESQAAVLFRGRRRALVRIRRDMGSLEGRRREMAGDLLDPDHDAKCCDLSRPRPYASHS